MSVSLVGTFTCDRDGVTAEATSEGNAMNPPVGWGRLTIDVSAQGQGGGVHPPVMGHLCPACLEAFDQWLGSGLALTGKAAS